MKAMEQSENFRTSIKEQICKMLVNIYLNLNDDIFPNWEEDEEIYVECDEISEQRLCINIEVGNTYDESTYVDKWYVTTFIVTLDNYLYLQFEDSRECDWTDINTDDLVKILTYLENIKK